jgi:hypothetical protein
MIAMSSAVTIRDLEDGERAWANDLYRAIRFETTPPGAIALVARREQTPHPERLWCIPFAHLSAFYQSCGFALRAPPWPPSVAAKVSHCVEDGLPDVVVLVR